MMMIVITKYTKERCASDFAHADCMAKRANEAIKKQYKGEMK